MYTMEYYLDTKKSEMKLFAATCIQTEVTIQGEQIRETKTNTICCHVHVGLKMNLFYKTDSWT